MRKITRTKLIIVFLLFHLFSSRYTEGVILDGSVLPEYDPPFVVTQTGPQDYYDEEEGVWVIYYAEGKEIKAKPRSEIKVSYEGRVYTCVPLKDTVKGPAEGTMQIVDGNVFWTPPAEIYQGLLIEAEFVPKGTGTGGEQIKFGFELKSIHKDYSVKITDYPAYVYKGDLFMAEATMQSNQGDVNISGRTVKFKFGELDPHQTITNLGKAFWIDIDTSDMAPGTYDLEVYIKAFEDEDFVLQDSEEVIVFEVEIKEIWSDMLDGVKVNYHPGGAGGAGANFLLVSPIDRGDDLKIKARIKLNPDNTTVKDKILLRLVSANGGIHGESSISGDIASISLPEILYSTHGVINQEGSIVVAGFDENENNILELAEIRSVYNDCSFFVICKDNYDTSKNLLTVAWLPMQFNSAGKFLYAFRNAIPVPDVSSVDTYHLAVNQIAHNVGVVFTAGGTGPIILNRFDNNNPLTQAVLDSNAFINILLGIFDGKKGIVQQYFDNSEDETHEFIWSLSPATVIEYKGADSILHLTFGRATLWLDSIKVEVEKVHIEEDEYDYNVIGVTVTGGQTDIYDFEYYGDGPLGIDIPAASVQSGYSTLGNVGYVFKSEISFDDNVVTHGTIINYNFK